MKIVSSEFVRCVKLEEPGQCLKREDISIWENSICNLNPKRIKITEILVIFSKSPLWKLSKTFLSSQREETQTLEIVPVKTTVQSSLRNVLSDHLLLWLSVFFPQVMKFWLPFNFSISVFTMDKKCIILCSWRFLILPQILWPDIHAYVYIFLLL